MADKVNLNNRTLEKLLILVLFITTIVLFSTWGYDASVYVLGQMFDVAIPDATPITFIEGILAMAASVLVFIGGVFWWNQDPSAKTYLVGGALGFLGKNVLDVINHVVIFSQQVTNPGVGDIKALAMQFGTETLQAGFWVFILFYFSYRINNYVRSKDSKPEAAQEGVAR